MAIANRTNERFILSSLDSRGRRLPAPRFSNNTGDGDDSSVSAGCRIAQMKATCTYRSVFFAWLLVMAVATVTVSEDLSGTRPGAEGQPLTISGTLFLLDVSKIDGADQSFTADVFMMLQWRDERLASQTERMRRLPLQSVWNPRVQIINQRRIWKTFPDEVDVAPDGTVVYRQRYYGQFASALDLRDFPLDRHRFGLQLVVPGYGPQEIEFVPSTDLGEGRSAKITVPDWSVGPFEVRTTPYAIIPGCARNCGSGRGVRGTPPSRLLHRQGLCFGGDHRLHVMGGFLARPRARRAATQRCGDLDADPGCLPLPAGSIAAAGFLLDPSRLFSARLFHPCIRRPHSGRVDKCDAGGGSRREGDHSEQVLEVGLPCRVRPPHRVVVLAIVISWQEGRFRLCFTAPLKRAVPTNRLDRGFHPPSRGACHDRKEETVFF